MQQNMVLKRFKIHERQLQAIEDYSMAWPEGS